LSTIRHFLRLPYGERNGYACSAQPRSPFNVSFAVCVIGAGNVADDDSCQRVYRNELSAVSFEFQGANVRFAIRDLRLCNSKPKTQNLKLLFTPKRAGLIVKSSQPVLFR
jgi:hypothetical protein